MKKTWYYWLIVICCCGMAAATPGILVNSSGVFYGPVAKSMGVGIGSVSFYITVQNLVSGFGGPFAVKLSRKLGLQKLLFVGAVLASLGYFGMSRVTAVWQMYFLAFLIGGSSSFFALVFVSSVLGNWFEKHTGLVTGVAFGFSGLAGAAFSPFFTHIIQTAGWRRGYMTAGVLLMVVLLPAILFVRVHPSEVGLPRWGSGEKVENVKAAAAPRESKPVSSGVLPLLCVATVLGGLITGLGTQMATYATSVNLVPEVGALLVSSVMVGNTASKLIAGVLCDSIGPKRSCCVIMGSIIVGCLCLMLLSGGSVVILMPAAFLVGMTYSTSTVLMTSICKQIYGLERFSSVYSRIVLCNNVGSAVATFAIGAAYDLFQSFVPMLLTGCILALVVMSLVFTAYRHQKKEDALTA